jgi:hypothetical protein
MRTLIYSCLFRNTGYKSCLQFVPEVEAILWDLIFNLRGILCYLRVDSIRIKLESTRKLLYVEISPPLPHLMAGVLC